MPTGANVNYSILWQPGLVALALAVAAFTLLVLVTSLLNAFERKGGGRVYTQEYRYRFYAVFSALMFVIVAYALGTFVFASSGGLFKAVRGGAGWAQIALAFTSVMPVLLLELIYTRNFHGLGFTVIYGQALPNTPLSGFIARSDERYNQFCKGKTGHNTLIYVILKPLYFLPGWLAQYLFNAMLASYVKATWRKLKGSWNATNTWLQLLEDVLVWITTLFFFFTFVEGVFKVVFGPGSLFSPIWVLLGFSLACLVVLAVVYFLLFTRASGKDGKGYAIMLPVAVIFLILFDFVWQLDRKGALGDWGQILAFFGGFGPLAAFALLLWLGAMFVKDYDEFQGRVNDLFRQEVSANFLDRALHNFGNALPTIEASFRAESRLLNELGKRTQLTTDDGDLLKALQTAQSQLLNGQDSLERARNDLDAIKSGRSSKNRLVWVPIQGILAKCKQRITSRGVKFIMIPQGKLNLHTDENNFRLTLENLIDNACDAMIVNGTKYPKLMLKYGRLGSGKEVDEPFRNGLYIDIQDNGPGIPSQIRERVFEQYFSTKATGMGIGLTIAKAFMTENNGSIAIRDDRSGACFRLSFPAEKVRVE